MLGSGRPFVLEVINARAAVPPQSVFEAMQAALQQVLLTGSPTTVQLAIIVVLLVVFAPYATPILGRWLLPCPIAAQNVA